MKLCLKSFDYLFEIQLVLHVCFSYGALYFSHETDGFLGNTMYTLAHEGKICILWVQSHSYVLFTHCRAVCNIELFWTML